MRLDRTEHFLYLVGLKTTIKLLFLVVAIQTDPSFVADTADKYFVAVTKFLILLNWL